MQKQENANLPLSASEASDAGFESETELSEEERARLVEETARAILVKYKKAFEELAK